jgi:hypothetical protein
MGRWAQAARRGGVGPKETGTAPAAPGNGNWTLTSPSSGILQGVGVGSFPGGIGSYILYYRLQGTTPWLLAGFQTVLLTNITKSGLAGGSTQEAVIAWGDATGQQVSGLSPIKTQVIT